MLNLKQHRIFDSHVWLVRPIALGLSAAWRDLDFDDAYQDGCLGLMGACSKYRPAFRERFPHYARLKIRFAIIDGFRKRCPLGRSAERAGRQIVELNPESLQSDSESETAPLAPAALVDKPNLNLLLFRVDLRRHLRRLSDVERFVLWAIYEAEWPRQRIADHLGVCRSQVCIIHRRLLRGFQQSFGAGRSGSGRRGRGQSEYASRSSLMVR